MKLEKQKLFAIEWSRSIGSDVEYFVAQSIAQAAEMSAVINPGRGPAAIREAGTAFVIAPLGRII
jgi:hypothetical protein